MSKDKELAQLKAAEIARQVVKEQFAASQFEVSCVAMVQASRKAAKNINEYGMVRARKSTAPPIQRVTIPVITIDPDKC
jgi:predicted transcriptional regulator